MDSWKFFLLIHQLAYFVYLSLVEFVKSFLGRLGLITCGNNFLCYIALTALKARDSCLWYLDSGCSRHMIGNKGLSRPSLKERLGQSLLEMEANLSSEALELWTSLGYRFLKMFGMLMD